MCNLKQKLSVNWTHRVNAKLKALFVTAKINPKRNVLQKCDFSHKHLSESESQYSTVVLTVVRVMIAKYRKSGIWGYRSSLTPEPVELK